MSAVSAQPNYYHHHGSQHALAPELGLHGIPTRSLVEFEGGGSMLSRDLLGEMLATNKQGVLDHTNAPQPSQSGTKSQQRTNSKEEGGARWSQGLDGGTAEEGKRARLLCQADALVWLRESAQTNLGWQEGLQRKRGSAEGRRRPQQSSAAHGGWSRHRGDGREQRRATTHRSSASGAESCSNSTKRRRTPVKLYDHDNNPRVLRTLVDDAVVTGLAGGVLKAEEGHDMDELKLQLRLACHRATELEDQVFQSQTGAPHRELLGELQLDRAQSVFCNRQEVVPNPKPYPTSKSCQKRVDEKRQLITQRPSATLGKSSATRVTPVRRRHGASTTSRALSVAIERTTPNVRNPERKPGHKKTAGASVCALPHTPSSPPTLTGSLMRYLSSLRPFSANGARAAWGLAEMTGQFEGPTDLSRHHSTRSDCEKLWPVLFVIGDAKPTTRHPLGVYSLPHFDDELCARLVRASGLPLEKVLAMTRVLARFDMSALQSAVKDLFCTNYARGERTRVVGANGGRPGRWGADNGSIAQAWVRLDEEHKPSDAGTSEELNGRAEPAILSESTASRALTEGFLAGVFADSTVEAIIAASRPLVVFDSAAAEQLSTVEEVAAAVGGVAASGPAERESVRERDVACGREDDDSGEVDIEIERSPPRPKQAIGDANTTLQHTLVPGTCQDSSSLACPAVLSTGGVAGSTYADTSGPTSEGVLVAQLVRVAATRFRVHSVAIRLIDGEAVSSPRSFDLESSRRVFIGGRGGAMEMGSRRRPASADSDELGLPPLKLLKRDTRRLPRAPWAEGEQGGGITTSTTTKGEQELDEFGFLRPRSTPRYLRPGFKGKVTAAMLRQELEASEKTAARLGMTMAKKAKAWKTESQKGSTADIADTTHSSTALPEAAALELAGAHARDALIAAAKGRMRDAVNLMYLGIIRRSWTTWMKFTRRWRSLEAAERFTRLVGAAALGSGVLEPLMRRRKRVWLRRWAAAMRAERVLEVQAAAVELQRAVRGFVGRTRARTARWNRAATAIQRIARGRQGRARGARRARFLLEIQAVQTIERKYREFVWQRDAVKLRKRRKRERAATKVQAAWRGLVDGRRPARHLREARRAQISAVMVQRLWRGVAARLRAESLLEAKNMRKAAVRVQSVARGRRARNIFGPAIARERAAVSLSCSWRCASARLESRTRRNRAQLALVVNPLVRGFLGRLELREAQAERYRQQQAILVACIAAQRMFRGKQGRLTARRELLRRCTAVELQRITRGRKVRRMSRVKEEELRAQLASWPAAVAVQKLWRGLKGRRKFSQKVAGYRRHAAAFTIQSAFRRRRFRRLRHLRRLASFAAATAAEQSDGIGDVGGKVETKARSREGSWQRREATDGNNADKAGGSGMRGGRAAVAENDSTLVGSVIIDTGGRREVGRGASAVLASQDKVVEIDPTSPIGYEIVDTSGAGTNGRHDHNMKLAADVVYEDMGDVALAAVASSRSLPPEEEPPAPPTPVSPSPHPSAKLPKVDIEMPPMPEPTLEYYEAKLKYLAAQEAAHGASAAAIQCMFRLFAARRRANIARANKVEFARSQARRGRAAVTLQAGARGRGGRRLAAKKRAALDDAARRERGVVTLQCTARLFVAKRRLLHLREEEQARIDRINRMASRIQARVRGYQTREIWRKFFRSRALLERERQRRGAQKVQMSWRSKLAKTELQRRKSLRDEALLAEELERHLKSILNPAMEAEREHAYAVRAQCWWRGILAVRAKQRLRRELREVAIVEGLEEEKKAALVIQCHWRAFKARCYYSDNYASLFRKRERKKYCTECQGEYATRKCRTCLDKFCERCWARIHAKGARRFHHWEPFATFSYDELLLQANSNNNNNFAAATANDNNRWDDSTPQQAADLSITTAVTDGYNSNGYYGYFPDWDGSGGGGAEDYWGATEKQQQHHTLDQWAGTTPQQQQLGGGGDGSYDTAAERQLWAIDPLNPAAYGPGASAESPAVDFYSGSYTVENSSGGQYYEYGGYGAPEMGGTYEYSYQNLSKEQDQQQQVWDGQQWSYPKATENDNEPQVLYNEETLTEYSGAAAYGDTGTDAGWWDADGQQQQQQQQKQHGQQPNQQQQLQQWSDSSDDAFAIGGEAEGYYDGAETLDQVNTEYFSSGAGVRVDAGVDIITGVGAATDWGGWATPDGQNDAVELYTASLSSGTGGAGGTRGTTGSSSGRPWSVNEYGQRVSGDWVEYWDESAQAAYFYNTVTGEASWTEPATG